MADEWTGIERRTIPLDQAERVLEATHVLVDEVRRASLITKEGRRRIFKTIVLSILISVPVAAYLAVTFHDEHFEHCSAFGYPKAEDKRLCDLTFMFHNHDPGLDDHQREVLFELFDEWRGEQL